MNVIEIRKKYEALGFVEALMAILVTGMASVALMDIAARTMTDTIRNEMVDVMTQYAIEGAQMVQIIADEEREEERNVFPNADSQAGSCFLMNNDVTDPSFIMDDEGIFEEYDYLERENFKEAAVIEKDDDYFRIFCRTDDIDINQTVIVGKIVVGLVNRTGTVSGSDLVYNKGGINNISDYEHYTIVKL